MIKKNNVCVIGVGRFGTAVIEQLVEQNHSVLAIDLDSKALTKVSSPLVSTVILDAADLKGLQSSGIQEIDTVIVGLSENIEIVAALLELNIKHIIARASSNRHARVLRQIGVDVIVRPERESGIQTAIIATNSNFIKFSKSLTEIGEGFVIGSSYLINEKYVDISIKDAGFNNLGITIVLIKRNNDTFLPSGNLKLSLNDALTVVGKIKDVTNFFGLINIKDYNKSNKKRVKLKKYGFNKTQIF